MKTNRLLIVLVLMLCLSAFASVASADPGDATSPQTAAYVDGATRSIPGSSALWFKFDYAGGRSDIVVTLPYRARDGMEFYVYTPAEIQRFGWDAKAIGRGTTRNNDQDSLVWIGAFIDGGTYYIKVVNPKSEPRAFELKVEGKGVIGISETTCAVVRALLDKEIDLSGIETEEQLTERIRDYWEAED